MEDHVDVRGESSPAEEREAGTLAVALMAVMSTSQATPKVKLAAAGLFMRLAFGNMVKQQFRVRAWEDFAHWTRSKLVEENRNAAN